MRLFRSARWLVLALLISLLPASSYAGIFISVGFAPPVLPVYVQPPCPQPNLMWMPGYWHYGPFGYYWVPGAWVPAPYAGALWTPGYWGWSGGMYVFHDGYWGPHIGYYGGVNYGFGYGGIGFAGGEWRGGVFAYNTAVINVNTTIIHTTFVDRTVVERGIVANPNHVAFSGGPGGVQHQPTPQETAAMHETHLPPTKFQQQHIETAKADKTSYAKNNGGHPKNVAVAKPLAAETHPAPAAAHTAASTGGDRPKALTPGKAEPGAERGTNASKPPVRSETQHNTAAPAPRSNTAMKPSPAPKSSPKPPANKPKPEGHEKQ